MDPHDFALLSRRDRLRVALFAAALVALALWVVLSLLRPMPPRRIVLASGPEFGLYHRYAQRYREILAREGVTVRERMTDGAAENLRLLLDPKSGVDVAFMQGGIATSPAADDLVMLASLYYEPLWIFYRASETLTQINQLRGKRVAGGVPGSGTRALVDRLLEANGIRAGDGAGAVGTQVLGLGGSEAIDALKAGRIDAAFFVGGAQTPIIRDALVDPGIGLMSLVHADAYPRRFPFITRLTLPAGTIDLEHNVPSETIEMIGTKAMLAARDDLHPALINLLVDAARNIHGEQGAFEASGEFPGTAPVDLRVSAYADEHKRFGSSFLYRYLPFWVAAIVERTIIVVVPLLVVLVPLVNYLPAFMRWRVRSRIYRWYGELSLLEHAVHAGAERLPIDQWLRDLDRIENAVGDIRTPAKFASEAYTLREHIDLVRREVLARAAKNANDAGVRPLAAAPEVTSRAVSSRT